MSETKQRKEHTIKGHDGTTAVVFVGAFAALVAVVLFWKYERWLVTMPVAAYLLPQDIMIHLTGRAPRSQLWIEYLRSVLDDGHIANNVDFTTLTAALSYTADYMWFLYSGLFILAGITFVRGIPVGFYGDYHLTGKEYVNYWHFAGRPVFKWINTTLLNAEDRRSGIRGKLLLWIFRAMPKLTAKKVRHVKIERSFIDYQSRYWRLMKPIAIWDPFDCIKELAPDMRPEAWALELKIISQRSYDEIVGRKASSQQMSPLPYSESRAQKAFVAQVVNGGAWSSAARCPPYIRALFTILYLNRNGSQNLGIELAYSCAEAAVPLFALKSNASRDQVKATKSAVNSAIERLLNGTHSDGKLPRKPLFTPAVAAETDKLAEGHHWLRTVIVALFSKSGPHQVWGGGRAPMVQPALFTWLRAFDRPVFYSISCIGAETFIVEAMGIISHYQAENAWRENALTHIRTIERTLANEREKREMSAEDTGGASLMHENPAYETHLEGLRIELQDWQKKLNMVPIIHVEGPLEWLNALIVFDRNLAKAADA